MTTTVATLTPREIAQQKRNVRRFARFLERKVKAEKFQYRDVLGCIEVDDPAEQLNEPGACGTACAYGWLPICFPERFHYAPRSERGTCAGRSVVLGLDNKPGLYEAERLFGIDFDRLYDTFFGERGGTTKNKIAAWLRKLAGVTGREGSE